MKTAKIQFESTLGQQLSASLDSPLISQPKAFVLFAHCFTCSKDLNIVRQISLSMTQKGFAVLRFDFTGLGHSEGKFSESVFKQNIDDLVIAARYLEDNYKAPAILIGHSLGGAAAIHAAAKIPSLEALVTIGSPNSPDHVKHLFQDSEDIIHEKGIAEVNIGGRPFEISSEFIHQLESHACADVIKNNRIPLLILHSPQDNVVGIENARKIYESAHHPKSFISLDGADHLLSSKEDSRYVGEVIASWSSRYVNMDDSQVLETEKQAVVRTSEDGYTTEIKVGPHYLIADEPKEVGGQDLGPTPYGLLISSLGACTSMTLRMYADHKKWDLKEVRVHLSHEKTHATDSLEGNQKIDLIEREIELEGNLDDVQRSRLIEIADRCPVHRTLHGTVEVHTKLR